MDLGDLYGAGSVSPPVGIVLAYVGATAPDGWLICDGSTFNVADYPDLNTLLGSNILPDLRGEFIRGLDNGRGVDTGRTNLSAQGDAIRNITGSFELRRAQTNARLDNNQEGAFSSSSGSYVGDTWNNNSTDKTNSQLDFDASRVVPTASENRPRNIAMNYIIKT